MKKEEIIWRQVKRLKEKYPLRIKKLCKHCGKNHIYHHKRQDYCKLRLHEAWRNMKKRCYDPRTHKYEYYGGKGVTVCSEWKHDKHKFVKWALDNNYQNNLTLNRINGFCNYSPQNCEWITWEENNQRRKMTKKASYNKCYEKYKLRDAKKEQKQQQLKKNLDSLYWQQKYTIQEIAEHLGVSYLTIWRWMEKCEIPRRHGYNSHTWGRDK